MYVNNGDFRERIPDAINKLLRPNCGEGRPVISNA